MRTFSDAIGPFQITRHLGSGGMSAVYLAHDPRLERFVAIKVLHAGQDSHDNRRRLVREARLAGSLNHRNIVTIYAVDEQDGVPYIVMEYVVGETLAALIQSKIPMGIVRRLELMDDLCAGLAYAWRKLRLVHRDIKPSNLMVDRNEVLRILDFGIARATEQGSMNATRIAGTPAYMAPEQIAGKPVDHRADIFSAGIVLYELLAYRRAFQGESEREVFEKVLKGEPVPLLECDPALDPELARIVEHAMRKDATDRYPDIEAMRIDLRRVRERLQRSQASVTTLVPAISTNRPAAAPVDAGTSIDHTLQAARSERIHEHLNAARQALRMVDFVAASDNAEQVLSFDPQHAEALKILETATEQLDLHRAAGWLQQARDNIAGGELALAAELVDEAARLGAAEYDVKSLRRELERAVSARGRLGDRQSMIVNALAEARRRLAAGDHPGTVREAEKVLEVDNHHVEALELRGLALTALASQRRSERHTEVAKAAIESAHALADQGGLDLAVEMLAVFQPAHPLVTAALAELRVKASAQARVETERRARELRVTQLVSAALGDARRGRWAEAQRHASDALALDGSHEQASRVFQEASDALEAERRQDEWQASARRLIDDARARAGAGELEDAIDRLRAFGGPHDAVDQLRVELEQSLARQRQEQAAREEQDAAERRAREQQDRKQRQEDARRARRIVARARELALKGTPDRGIALLNDAPPHPVVDAFLAELQAQVDAERNVREEERLTREREERTVFEEAERQARLDAERRARDEAAAQTRLDAAPDPEETPTRVHQAADQPGDVTLAMEVVLDRTPVPRQPANGSRSLASRTRAVGIGALAVVVVVVAVVTWPSRPAVPASGIGAATASAPAPAAPPVTTIHIESDPTGATVTIDGIAQALTTPADIQQHDPGKPLTVRLTHPGFQERVLTVQPADLASGNVRVALTATPQITVDLSGPYPFEVLDGRVSRPARLQHRFTLSEARTLRLRSVDWFLNRTISVNAQPGRTFTLRLPEPGQISVRAPKLEQCGVTIGGHDLATPSFPPVSRRAIADGVHVVVMSCPDGRKIERRVTVPAGGHITEIIR